MAIATRAELDRLMDFVAEGAFDPSLAFLALIEGNLDEGFLKDLKSKAKKMAATAAITGTLAGGAGVVGYNQGYHTGRDYGEWSGYNRGTYDTQAREMFSGSKASSSKESNPDKKLESASTKNLTTKASDWKPNKRSAGDTPFGRMKARQSFGGAR